MNCCEQHISRKVGVFLQGVERSTDLIDCTPRIYDLYSTQYNRYTGLSPFKWQLEIYSVIPTQGMRFFIEADNETFFFGSLSLTFLRGTGIADGYSMGGKFSSDYPFSCIGPHWNSNEKIGLLYGILGIIGKGAGVGTVIETGGRVTYYRFWGPSSR